MSQQTKRACLYLRVSTAGQSVERQEAELREAAGRAGYEVVRVYEDKVSGAAGRERRSAFDQMHRDMARRQFDVVMVWSVDRLSRSLQNLVAFLSEVHALRLDLFILTQGIDTTTPAGRAMFQLLGVFGDLERALIRERVLSGLARARRRGVRLGRPPLDLGTEQRVRRGLERGETIAEVARKCRVGTSTVKRVRRRMRGGSDRDSGASLALSAMP